LPGAALKGATNLTIAAAKKAKTTGHKVAVVSSASTDKVKGGTAPTSVRRTADETAAVEGLEVSEVKPTETKQPQVEAQPALQAQDAQSAYTHTEDMLREALNRLDELAKQVGEVKQQQLTRLPSEGETSV
jgi:hypothetical protein